MIYKIITKNYQDVFLCILAFVTIFIPSIIDRTTKLRLPGLLQLCIVAFIFASTILGEIFNLYSRFPLWDVILHTFSGFITAAIGFSILTILHDNKESKNVFTPGMIILMAFCFSLTIGVFWEFVEFGCDQLFDLDMQKDYVVHEIHTVLLDKTKSNEITSFTDISKVTINGQELELDGYLDIGLIDSMKDLFCNTIGSLIFILFGYIYLKKGSGWKWVRNFTPKEDRQ